MSDARLKIAVARARQERDRALAADASPLRAARLNFNGAGMTTLALARLANVSRDTIRRAEADPSSVSLATLRRLAAALDCRVRDIT